MIWKILGGVVVGVVAIAAGGVAGAAWGDSDESARQEGYSEGQKEAKAEYSMKINKLEKTLAMALDRLIDNKANIDYFNAKFAMVAVAVACTNCDGKISIDKRDEIEQFVNGLSSISLPNHVKERIQRLYEKPLNIRESFALAQKSGLEWSVFDDVVNLMIHTDGITHDNKDAFVQVWKQLRAA